MEPVVENKSDEKNVITPLPNEVNTTNQDNLVQKNDTQETIQERNWRQFRETREAERRQREAAEKKALEKEAEAAALKAAMESILNKPMAKNTTQEFYNEEETTEEQKIQKLVEEALSKERQKEEELRRQKETQELPQKLTATFSDFNQVCTTENLDYLEYHYPEIASAFRHAPEGFEKWSSVYKAVKRFVPNIESKKEQKKAEQNFNKPQSMSIPGMTPTGDTAPVQLDDKRRQENWLRMQRVMKGAK